MKKFLFALLLSLSAFAVFACQYSQGSVPGGGYGSFNSIEWQFYWRKKLYLYLSGVNTPGNHISGIGYNDNAAYDPPRQYLTARNNMEISLPATVYIGTAFWRGLDGPLYYNNDDGFSNYDYHRETPTLRGITLTLQYRIIPSQTWHTAGSKKIANDKSSLLYRKNLLSSIKLDCDAPAGSTVLIRLYVTIDELDIYAYHSYYSEEQETYLNNWGTEYVYATVNYVENADPSSLAVKSASDIPDEEVLRFDEYYMQRYLLNFNIPWYYGELSANYIGNWSPQYLMAVKISNKRRPGK